MGKIGNDYCKFHSYFIALNKLLFCICSLNYLLLLEFFSLFEMVHFFVFLTFWDLKLCILFFFKRCFTGYTGERCEHLTLTSYAVDSYEKYIAIGIGVGLLLSGFLAIFYCYIRKRYANQAKYEVV